MEKVRHNFQEEAKSLLNVIFGEHIGSLDIIYLSKINKPL